MQNAKDSFYEVLRARLAAVNPERTIVVRGVTRPGVLVDENETLSISALPDCFHLRWGKCEVTNTGALPQVTQLCTIWYASAGSPWNGGLDRGRLLAAMDGELQSSLMMVPQCAPKRGYLPLVSGGQPSASGTQIWWSDPAFAEEEATADRLIRRSVVAVMSFQEAGEL